MKNIVIVTSSPRNGGNSETLAKKFAEGAKYSGNHVDFIAVRDLNLQFCRGCMACHKIGRCVIADGMNDLYPVFQNADVVVFASPVYYYAVSGQLKTFIDRLNPLYVKDNKFKEVYLISTAAENDKSAMEGSVKDIQGWADCFDGVSIKGVLYGIGLEGAADVLGSEFLDKAYEMGKNV